MKYTKHIYESVKSYNEENNNYSPTYEEIDKMPRSQVLREYLAWEGIIGYDFDILLILHYYD